MPRLQNRREEERALGTSRRLERGVGVVIALVGAVLMAVGAHLQSASLGRVAVTIPRPSLFQIAQSRTWLAGSLVLGVAIVLQLMAVTLAPVALVQPTGIIALVVSVAIRHGMDQRLPRLRTVVEVGVCVAAVVAFVLLAGQYTGPVTLTRSWRSRCVAPSR